MKQINEISETATLKINMSQLRLLKQTLSNKYVT